MPSKPETRWIVTAGLCLTACATVDPSADYAAAAAEIRSATGVAEVHQPGHEAAGEARVRDLCAEGLTLHEAVEVALLHNPGLQAAFHEVGIARADRVQAGLLTNPSLTALLKFPVDGGATNIEGGLFASLADLWQVGGRVRGAEAVLTQRILELAHGAVQLAGMVRGAYLDAQAAERLLAIAEDNRATADRMVELVEARVEARAATILDANLARLEQSRTEVLARDAGLAADQARRRLAGLLGYDALPEGVALTSPLPEAMVALPDEGRLAGLALEHRLDVRAAGEAMQAAVAEWERQSGLVFKRVDVGIVGERNSDWAVGPGIELELPLFDQNQAQVAKAGERVAQREKTLTAIRLQARQDVGATLARARAGQDAARLFAESILTRAAETLELAREAYRLGRTTIVPVLEAQRSVLEARRAHVVRLRDAARALSELEQAVGLPRERLFTSGADAPEKKE
ncbi:MAG: TolC family protein [Planctomycetota bacterium]